MEDAERMALVAISYPFDVESGLDMPPDTPMPPSWTDQLEEVQFTMSKLEVKINELKTIHSRHLHRPTLDESSEEEQLIERLTSDISLMFNSAHRLIQQIKYWSTEGDVKEQRLTQNIVKATVAKLQELSILFRSTQSNYVKQIKLREERSKIYFDDSTIKNDFEVFDSRDTIDDYFVNNKQATQQQLLLLEEENTLLAVQREQEVNSIVKSIVDLNDLFKDLSQMVQDQGTILDRIDYNIEQTQTQVFEGFKQLQKADQYQRKNRKMCCIIILAATTILLIILLIIFKT